MTLDNTVTDIAASVFAEKTIIKEVHVPSVKKIEAGAFKGATSLMKVELGAEIPDVADDAFAGTSEAKDLIVPEGAREQYKEFAAKHGFNTINGKEAYPIPEGVQIEGTELKGLTYMFAGNKLELPPRITKIRSRALFGKSLKSVTGLGIVEIEGSALRNSKELIEVNFPKLKKIAANAFENCPNLKTVHAPLVEEIGVGGFKDCKSLVEVNFPHLKTIPQGVFNARNGNLEKVVLSGVASIDDQAFANQLNIKSIEFGSALPKLTPQAFDDGLKSRGVTLFVPADAVSAYTNSGEKWFSAFKIKAKQ